MSALLLLAFSLGLIAFFAGWYRQTCIFWEFHGSWNVPSVWRNAMFRFFTWTVSTTSSLGFAFILAHLISTEVNDWVGRFSFGVLLVTRWMLSSMVAVSRAQHRLETLNRQIEDEVTRPSPPDSTDVTTSAETPIKKSEAVPPSDLPSLIDRERFLDLMYELGAKAVYEPEAIIEDLSELGIECELIPNGLLLFKKIPITAQQPEYGTSGIWPTDILRATIAHYGYEIHSRMSGRGYYHNDLLTKLAKEWKIARDYL